MWVKLLAADSGRVMVDAQELGLGRWTTMDAGWIDGEPQDPHPGVSGTWYRVSYISATWVPRSSI